jgi:2',3'-cyclic-nucleotide 2'-phosphodiesterase (5'-nucleotidase family)
MTFTGQGRFPQLSGIRVVVDASKPAGSRVTSVSIGDAPLDDSKEYTLATKPYMLDHDGYNLAGHPYVVDTEHGNLLSNLVRNYFKKAKVIDAWKHAGAVSPAMRALSALKKDKVQPHFAPQTDGRITFSEQ